jgi:hypothetical protein
LIPIIYANNVALNVTDVQVRKKICVHNAILMPIYRKKIYANNALRVIFSNKKHKFALYAIGIAVNAKDQAKGTAYNARRDFF